MAYSKESIEIIVKESIDGIVKTLTNQIYDKLNQTNNLSRPTIDLNQLPEEFKQKLIKYADNNGIIQVNNLTDNNAIKLVLEISAEKGHLEIIKYLVENGAEINDSCALSIGAENGHLDIVKFLVENGATIDGIRALSDSAKNGHLEVVKFLAEKCSEVSRTGALSVSAHNGHLAVVKFLVESGAIINDSDALYSSVCNGHLEIVIFLVDKYIETKTPIPDDCITKHENDINRLLFMCVGKDKHHLFNDKIVSALARIKNLIG